MNTFVVGDKVRTLKGCRMNALNRCTVRIVEVGRKWRHYDAVVGVKRIWNADLTVYEDGKKHIYLVKNLVMA